MLFNEVAIIIEEIEKNNLRNEKTRILAQLLAEVAGDEALVLCYLVVGRLAPLYVPLEFGMAEKSLIKTVAWATNKPLGEVESLFKEIGDLGEVYFGIVGESGSRMILPKPFDKLRASEGRGLSVREVYERLNEIAKMSGKGSQDWKVMALSKLLREMSATGAKYIVRLVSGKLRLGFSDMTILDSLSVAKKGDKSDRLILERAYNVTSDMGMIAKLYLEGSEITQMRVRPGVPVVPMRAERLGTIGEIIAKLGKCAVEPKLDGMRVQIHAFRSSENQIVGASDSQQNGLFESEEKERVCVRIFSRGLEDITTMFPELVQAARKVYAKVGAFVVDGEAIGVRKDGTFLPFQETIKRKRKYGVDEKVGEIPMKVFVFDVLYASGNDQLQKTYLERREILTDLLTNSEQASLIIAESKILTSEEEIRSGFEQAIERGLEGILVKKIDSVYRAGARDFAWVKYKRAHETDLADTVDAVVIGAYVGKGKRSKFGVGAFLVGVIDGERVVTLAKIGTGLTDAQFGELFAKINKCVINEKRDDYDVPDSLSPDIWVDPSIIVEIEADEITESPLHSAGYALRFPRLLRFREDKKLADITSKEEIKRLFEIRI